MLRSPTQRTTFAPDGQTKTPISRREGVGSRIRSFEESHLFRLNVYDPENDGCSFWNVKPFCFTPLHPTSPPLSGTRIPLPRNRSCFGDRIFDFSRDIFPTYSPFISVNTDTAILLARTVPLVAPIMTLDFPTMYSEWVLPYFPSS